MAEYRLTTPLSEEEVRKLKIGDTVFLEGTIFGIRDANLIRIFENNVPPPVDFTGAACIHTAPNVRKVNGGYEKVCIGTTTSSRMDRFTPGLMGKYGVRAIIGKAGMMEASMEAMKKYGGCYLAIVGGAASWETEKIQAIEGVWWEDLMPEAIWKFRVKDFGPLIVAMDAEGNNMYYQIKARAREKLADIYKRLGI
ncbi:FumA C-terminus/TtdB family hydratase beta subunit [Calderihabitans maritimus]|uniref:Fe-S type, tartrate/fumarate subfamily hydro-lyase subunit alpha n=1 Tax=Calderihabitans maritimus TaxID=1246530 RepID=A0A1Z5HV42_9FIRM|nr:FumA C-terminus/TtdB family hydratase beta subunit [Calderihabitans maritimus]GAW93217.1 Fe-S type, tartrate/fumarate subfamily hydro-lyase subunit alpha [Calderihabitans maritimus]